jgi:hypothetical protein
MAPVPDSDYRVRERNMAMGFVLLQLADAAGNELVPRRYVEAHLDRLGVPRPVQAVLPAIKVVSSGGLLLGLRWPRLGAVTSSCLIAFYAAAVGFHLNAGDHPVVAGPAVAFGLGAAALLAAVYAPALRQARSEEHD